MLGLKDKNGLDTNIFRTTTKEVIGKAEDKAFFTSFFTSNRVTLWIGFFGQFLSAITEFIFIFRACGGELPLWQNSNLIPFLSGSFAVFVFEYLGVRVYLIRIVRQIITGDFNSPQKVALFVLNVVFCLSILVANFGTSIVGQSTTFLEVKNIDNSDKIAKIDSLLIVEISEIKDSYNTLNDTLRAQAKRDKSDINLAYDVVRKDLKVSKWSEGADVSGINSDIVSSNSERMTNLQAITDTLNSRIAYNINLMDKAIKTANSKSKVKKDAIYKGENSSLDIYSMFERYSLFVLIAFMTLSILAIVYREIYINGSKQDVELKEVKQRPVLVFALIYGLYMKFYHACYWLVVKIVGSKAFDYSKIIQSKDDYLSTNVSTNSGLNIGLSSLFGSRNIQAPQAQQVRQIGFRSGGGLTQSEPNNSGLVLVQPIETQRDLILNKYNLNTVTTWYKRSDLVRKSQSRDVSTQVRNREKYLKAKKELLSVGARFSESRTNVSITI